ncbi:MAG TPA: glycosyltransferase [bacterium]|nr:glycosyltransferase [bacterium]
MHEKAAAATKIRVLYILPSLGIGGAERQLYYLLRDLDRNRFEASLMVFYHGGAMHAEFANLPNVQLFCLHKKSGMDFAYLYAAARIMRTHSFDVIHACNVSARLVGLFLAWWGRVPKTIMAERNASAVYSSLGSRLYHFFEHRAMRHATLVAANSEAGRRFCLKNRIPASRIRVINNGLDWDRLQPRRTRTELSWPSDRPVVGMVARLFSQKDPITFLKSARWLLQRMPQVQFLLVGDGPMRQEIEDKVQQWNLNDRVQLVGAVKEVADYLANMDVVVLTSKQSEGCANAVLEAMALSRPVIVTDVPGNSDLVEHGRTGLIVRPEDPQALGKALFDLLTQPDRGAALGRCGHEMVKREYDMKTMVAAYERLYAGCGVESANQSDGRRL